jgi:hypothetical protein
MNAFYISLLTMKSSIAFGTVQYSGLIIYDFVYKSEVPHEKVRFSKKITLELLPSWSQVMPFERDSTVYTGSVWNQKSWTEGVS